MFRHIQAISSKIFHNIGLSYYQDQIRNAIIKDHLFECGMLVEKVGSERTNDHQEKS